jgi:bifunctional DNase/RNase
MINEVLVVAKLTTENLYRYKTQDFRDSIALSQVELVPIFVKDSFLTTTIIATLY